MTWVLIIVSLYLVYFDIRYKRVPNLINLVLLLLVIGNRIWADLPLKPAIISWTVAFFSFFLIYVITKGKMGIGDCKYTGIIAFHFGYFFWLKSIIVCSIIALLITLSLLLLKKISRTTPIPFIPFLVSGWIIIYFIELY